MAASSIVLSLARLSIVGLHHSGEVCRPGVAHGVKQRGVYSGCAPAASTNCLPRRLASQQLDPNTRYGGAFTDALTKLNSNHEVVMMEILLIFALVHSGRAGFCATGARLIGKRAYRVLFARISLPLAVSVVVYFINHRYDGYQLWQFRTILGVHEFCWMVGEVLWCIAHTLWIGNSFTLITSLSLTGKKWHRTA